MDEDVAEEFLKVESFAAVGLAKRCLHEFLRKSRSVQMPCPKQRV